MAIPICQILVWGGGGALYSIIKFLNKADIAQWSLHNKKNKEAN